MASPLSSKMTCVATEVGRVLRTQAQKPRATFHERIVDLGAFGHLFRKDVSYPDQLWFNSYPHMKRTLYLPFVVQLTLGLLHPTHFDQFLKLDILFLQELQKTYEIALTSLKSNKMEHRDRLSRLFEHLVTGVDSEIDFMKSQLMDATASPSLSGYSNYSHFLRNLATTDQLSSLVFAVTPCNKIYYFLAKAPGSVAMQIPGNPYKDFYQRYLGKESSKSVYLLDQTTDWLITRVRNNSVIPCPPHLPDTSNLSYIDATTEALVEAYQQTAEMEVHFMEAASSGIYDAAKKSPKAKLLLGLQKDLYRKTLLKHDPIPKTFADCLKKYRLPPPYVSAPAAAPLS